MAVTKNGVSWYKKATLTLSFPEGDVRCMYCPCLETYARKQCRMTGEYLADGYLRGGMCPLVFESEENK